MVDIADRPRAAARPFSRLMSRTARAGLKNAGAARAVRPPPALSFFLFLFLSLSLSRSQALVHSLSLMIVMVRSRCRCRNDVGGNSNGGGSDGSDHDDYTMTTAAETPSTAMLVTQRVPRGCKPRNAHVGHAMAQRNVSTTVDVPHGTKWEAKRPSRPPSCAHERTIVGCVHIGWRALHAFDRAYMNHDVGLVSLAYESLSVRADAKTLVEEFLLSTLVQNGNVSRCLVDSNNVLAKT